MQWDEFGWLCFFSPGRCRVIPQKNHYFVPLFQCVHKCLHNPCTAAVQTTHATSISNPNRGGCMENWGVYAKPYVPCPWIIKLVLLEQRDLWRLLVLRVCRKQDYIQQLHPAASLLLRLILCISISRKQNLVQHYLIWSQLPLLFIFHFHRNNYIHSLFWIHIRASPTGSLELPIPSCMGLQRHNVHFFISASASKITFFISAVIYSSISEPVWKKMEAGDSLDSLKPWPQKSPAKQSRVAGLGQAGGRFQLLVCSSFATLQMAAWTNLPDLQQHKIINLEDFKAIWRASFLCWRCLHPARSSPECAVLGVTAAPFVEGASLEVQRWRSLSLRDWHF